AAPLQGWRPLPEAPAADRADACAPCPVRRRHHSRPTCSAGHGAAGAALPPGTGRCRLPPGALSGPSQVGLDVTGHSVETVVEYRIALLALEQVAHVLGQLWRIQSGTGHRIGELDRMRRRQGDHGYRRVRIAVAGSLHSHRGVRIDQERRLVMYLPYGRAGHLIIDTRAVEDLSCPVPAAALHTAGGGHELCQRRAVTIEQVEQKALEVAGHHDGHPWGRTGL